MTDLPKIAVIISTTRTGRFADVPAGWVSYSDWVAGHPRTSPEVVLTPQADAMQLYTSGTTGFPKGAVMTHEGVVIQLHQLAFCRTTAPGARMLIVAPMFHVGGLFGAMHALAAHGTVYVMEDFVPDEVVRVLDEEAIAFSFLAPAMIQAILTVVPDVPGHR